MSSGIGIDHDVVQIKLGDKALAVVEGYDIQMSVLTQPAAFSLRLGDGKAVPDILAAAAPNTPFELLIDGATQFKGRCDGPTVAGRGNAASEVTIRGRDHLAPLHDHHVTAAKSFSDITYVDLVVAALKEAAPDLHGKILSDDTANRKAVTKAPNIVSPGAASERVGTTELFTFDASGNKIVGHGVKVGVDPDTEASVGADSALSGSQKVIKAKIGERWYERVIKPELDRVGLVLFAASNGTDLILVEPNTTQEPIYRIFNTRGENSIVTIEGYNFKNETTTRYSFCDVHFRGGGDGVESRGRGWGHADDPEVAAFGIKRALTVEDHKCKSLAQADFLARRKIAESRRQNWSLMYTVEGHTVMGNAGQRVVWSPNTMVDVQDDELGIHGKLYIESVRFTRGPQTLTELHLMRPEDMLFREEE